MADKASKQPQNVPGLWYVDTSCALCRLCLEEEIAAAERAMGACPTLAIGNDG